MAEPILLRSDAFFLTIYVSEWPTTVSPLKDGKTSAALLARATICSLHSRGSSTAVSIERDVRKRNAARGLYVIELIYLSRLCRPRVNQGQETESRSTSRSRPACCLAVVVRLLSPAVCGDKLVWGIRFP